MNPLHAPERKDLRIALGSDKCVATYVLEIKRRSSRSGVIRGYLMYHTPAQEARLIVDEAMRGVSLTDLLYKSREDDQK